MDFLKDEEEVQPITLLGSHIPGGSPTSNFVAE